MGFEVYQLPLAGSLGTKSELNFRGDTRILLPSAGAVCIFFK